MTIRTMTLDDLDLVLQWAAEEGWNPGLDDAPAFFEADPAGFLIKEVGGKPAVAISVVNHDADFSFLGCICASPSSEVRDTGLMFGVLALRTLGAEILDWTVYQISKRTTQPRLL